MRYKILDQHGLNFLTLTVVEWIDLFTRRAFADMVVESLQSKSGRSWNCKPGRTLPAKQRFQLCFWRRCAGCLAAR